MNKINILGYSENVLSMVLETIKLKHPNQLSINVIQNMAIEVSEAAEYIPKDLDVNIVLSDIYEFNDLEKYVFGVFTPKVKMSIFQYFKNHHNITKNDYHTIVHPQSTLASSCRIEEGVYIEPGTIVSPFAKIGFGVSINRNTSIGHHTQIKDFTTIGPGVNMGGNSVIGEGVQIGIGSTIFNKISIGENTIIGGGSVVVKNIPANCIAYGNPCKVIKDNNLG